MILKKDRISFENGNLPLQSLIAKINSLKTNIGRDKLDLCPKYQRGNVWDQDFKEKLIYSIMVNYPIGSIIIRKLNVPNEKNADMEVVDGQQRLTTIYEFFNNNLELSYEISKKIVEENLQAFEYDQQHFPKNNSVKILNKYKNGKSFKIKFDNIPTILQSSFNDYPAAIIYLTHQDNEVVAEYFRFVQNQERLRAGEIINSIPESKIEKYIQKLENKENLLSVLRWSDTRKEFEKIFYSMIGIFDKKLNLGTQDNSILEYVSNFDIASPNADVFANKMIESLNAIGRLTPETIQGPFNKRLIKFLCLLSGFGFINFTNNTENQLSKLCYINKRISVFSSAQKNAVENEFRGNEAIQEKYRLVALVGKGSHAYNRVYERMQVLAELMCNEKDD